MKVWARGLGLCVLVSARPARRGAYTTSYNGSGPLHFISLSIHISMFSLHCHSVELSAFLPSLTFLINVLKINILKVFNN